MSHLPQDLHDFFPDDGALLPRLKAGDRHFRLLADRYAALDREIGQIGLGLEPASDMRTEDPKTARLQALPTAIPSIACAGGRAA